MSIFVLLASYRDKDCSYTLKELYNKAKYPKNIFVGICEQNNPNNKEEFCLFENNDLITKYKNNIKIISINNLESKGAYHSRYLCSTLYNNEDYFFQIDAHMKFVNNWDVLLIDMYNTLKNKYKIEKPLLSHYTKDINEIPYTNKNMITRICKSFFNPTNMISFLGAESIDISKNDNDGFYETPYIAGGFIFTSGEFLKEVPYNPDLEYLWVGEEIMTSIRAYTHGYRIFTPNKDITFHKYTRKESPHIWDDQKYDESKSLHKVRHLIGLSKFDKYKIDSKYGLGNKKSLYDYYNFAGIDKKWKKVNKNFCRQNNIDDNLENNTKNYYKLIMIINFIIYFIITFLMIQIFIK